MDAAAELIAERGWGAVTTRMVAERAGLRPGLVHYHFDSVTDLLIDSSLRRRRQRWRGYCSPRSRRRAGTLSLS